MAGYFPGFNRFDLLGFVSPNALAGGLTQPNTVILSSFSGDTLKSINLLTDPNNSIGGLTPVVAGSVAVTYKLVSSNPNIATVTDAGLVSAVAGAKGKTIITLVETVATTTGTGTTTAVNVIRVPVYVHNEATIFNINGNNTTVYVDLDTAAATGVDLSKIFVSASSASLSYTTTATNITVISGVAYAASATAVPGDATVKISQAAVNGSFVARADLNVTVKLVRRVNTITTDVSSATLSVSKKNQRTKRIVTTVLPANATQPTLSWSSSNPAVATVNSSGVIAAKKKGNAIITASSTDSSDAIAEVNVVVVK